MSDIEQALLGRIIKTGELQEVIHWGIGQQDFKNDRCRGYFDHMMSAYQAAASRGSVVGPHEMERTFPSFEYRDDPNVTTDMLCHQVRKNRLIADARVCIDKMADEVEIDPLKAIGETILSFQQLAELGDMRNTDVMFGKAMATIVEDHRNAQEGRLPGIMSFPWKALQDETGGVQKDDYIVLYGRPKSMKSFVLAFLVAWAYLQGLRVLLFTREMTPINILRRVAGFMAEVPYSELRRGRLSRVQEANLLELQAMAEEIGQNERLICLSGKDARGTLGGTVTWLQAKVERYRPDVLFVDGLYLLKTTGKFSADNQRVQAISREMRDMILETEVPAICTAQANRNAAKHNRAELDEVAHSDAISQDATAAFRVMRETTTDTIVMATAGSREWKLEGFRINAQPCQDFSQRGDALTEVELQLLQGNEEENKQPKRAAARRVISAPASGGDQVPIKSRAQLEREQIRKALKGVRV